MSINIATLHGDEPAPLDGLDRMHLVGEIATQAATAIPPLVLGVHGDWGSGKTTFMMHVRDTLESGPYKNGVVTVWFEAWRYQNEPAPVVALLQEMRRAFSKMEKIKRKFKKWGEVTLRTLLNNLNDLAKLVQLESLPFSAEKIQALGEQWEKEHLENQLVVDSLQQNLQEAIAILLPESKTPTPRAVIFIDDLDRCNPEMAYRLLEGLKIYLSLKNCVFVLAMNQQVITEAIAVAMKKEDNDPKVKLQAEAYLEKLCANIWRLPPPKLPAGFFVDLLDAADGIPQKAITAAAIGARHGFLPPNPRRLKALANLYNRLWLKTATLRAGTSDPETLTLRVLVLAYVYQFHSELYHRWRHDPYFFEALRAWITTGQVNKVEDRDGKQVPDPLFFALILPTRSESDASQPTPTPTIHGNYPNPAAPGVFWIAPLLQGRLANDKTEDYRPLLLLENA